MKNIKDIWSNEPSGLEQIKNRNMIDRIKLVNPKLTFSHIYKKHLHYTGEINGFLIGISTPEEYRGRYSVEMLVCGVGGLYYQDVNPEFYIEEGKLADLSGVLPVLFSRPHNCDCWCD